MTQLINRIKSQVKQCKQASRNMALASSIKRNELLVQMAATIKQSAEALIAANKIDIKNAIKQQLSNAMIDRLTLDQQRIRAMADALIEVSNLPDPLQRKGKSQQQPSGIVVQKQAIPLGVILMVYESRPNVTVDAAALAVKAGNSIILRGGKEAFQTNQCIAGLWQRALRSVGLDENAVVVLDSTERSLLEDMLHWDHLIDLVIPRGGEGLIRYVVENSRIPVIKHYKGVCHLYVDENADFDKAIAILINGKTQRPGVCNALETLLIDKSIATDFLPRAIAALEEKNVSIVGCEESQKVVPTIALATDEDFAAEFLDLKISIKLVDGVAGAVKHIQQFGSQHTEVIISENQQHCDTFIRSVDASVVMTNASSRFSDGGELGLGAEIGISTSKLHAYGPMGLESLTTERFVVRGDGQIRQ